MEVLKQTKCGAHYPSSIEAAWVDSHASLSTVASLEAVVPRTRALEARKHLLKLWHSIFP